VTNANDIAALVDRLRIGRTCDVRRKNCNEAAYALESQARRIAELEDLLRGSRTHLMQGDHSEWRKRVDAALSSGKGETT
jgi:hypothetical protein